MRSIVLGLAIVGFGLNPCAANAALVMLQAAGYTNNGFGTTPAGSAFLAEITFDDAQAPTPVGPTGAIYEYKYSARVTIGSETATFLSEEFWVDNNGNFNKDRVTFFHDAFVMGGIPFAYGRFEFIDNQMTALSSANLPFSTNLSDWEVAQYVAIAGETAQIAATITSLQVSSVEAAVPEPATLAMWGLGALGMGLTRLRRRKWQIAV